MPWKTQPVTQMLLVMARGGTFGVVLPKEGAQNTTNGGYRSKYSEYHSLAGTGRVDYVTPRMAIALGRQIAGLMPCSRRVKTASVKFEYTAKPATIDQTEN